MPDYRPDQLGFPIPTAAPGAAPLLCVQLNEEWIPLVAGAATQLLSRYVWEADDLEDVEDVIRQVEDLLVILDGAACTPAGGTMDYTVIVDRKSRNVAGGALNSGSPNARALNTIITATNPAGISVDAATGIVTLPAGNYRFQASAPAFNVGRHQAYLVAAATTFYGSTEVAGAAASTTSRSLIAGRFVFGTSNTLRIWHMCQTSNATSGAGLAGNLLDYELYTLLELWREPD